MIIRAIEPLAVLTKSQAQELAQLVEDVGEVAAGWLDEDLVVYVVCDPDAAYDRAQRLVVAPRSDDLKPGDTVVCERWTATRAHSHSRGGVPVETDAPRLDAAGRLGRVSIE